MNIKWLLGGHDVTDMSRGKTYSRGHTVSELQVNFTSVSDVRSSYKCEEVGILLLRCRKEVSCLAVRNGTNGHRNDYIVEVVIGKEDTWLVGHLIISRRH